MRSYPALDPKTPFQRIPFKPHDLTAPITRIEGLFVLAHLGVPHVDPETWTLTIDGPVRRPMRLTLEELKQQQPRLPAAGRLLLAARRKPPHRSSRRYPAT
jgi:DMSO/TMAO reductase YedYZ molybdopterin-dependent catalytic subunit